MNSSEKTSIENTVWEGTDTVYQYVFIIQIPSTVVVVYTVLHRLKHFVMLI